MCPAPGLSLWSRSSYRKSEEKWKKLCAGRPEQSGLGESAFKNKPKSRRSTEVSQQTFFFLAGRHLLFPKLKAWRQYLIPRSCLQPVSLEAICSQPWGRRCMWDTGEGGTAVTPVASIPSGPPWPLPQEELLCLKHHKSPQIYLWACWIVCFFLVLVCLGLGAVLFLALFYKKK